MGKIFSFKRKRREKLRKNTGLKGDKLVGNYYVEFDKQMNIEVQGVLSEWEGGNIAADVQQEYLKLKSAREGKNDAQVKELDSKLKELAKNHTLLLKEAKENADQMEARDPQVYLLWSTMNGWVYDGFDETYKTMGVDFDKLYYESDTYLLGKDVVSEGLGKGRFLS